MTLVAIHLSVISTSVVVLRRPALAGWLRLRAFKIPSIAAVPVIVQYISLENFTYSCKKSIEKSIGKFIYPAPAKQARLRNTLHECINNSRTVLSRSTELIPVHKRVHLLRAGWSINNRNIFPSMTKECNKKITYRIIPKMQLLYCHFFCCKIVFSKHSGSGIYITGSSFY